MCLADPVGKTPLDADIRKQQAQVKVFAGQAQYWLQAGRGWVRKARMTTDPGFYLNVDACVEMALKIEPNRADALALRGLALMNGHQFSEAKALATKNSTKRTAEFGRVGHSQRCPTGTG